MIAALHEDPIARGRQASSCPCGGEEGRAIVVAGVMGTLDDDACVTGPTTNTAAQMGSQASFTLADDLPPCQGAWQ